MSEKPKSNHSQAAKAHVQFRAFRRRVTMESADRNRWRIILDRKLTDLIVTCFIHAGR